MASIGRKYQEQRLISMDVGHLNRKVYQLLLEKECIAATMFPSGDVEIAGEFTGTYHKETYQWARKSPNIFPDLRVEVMADRILLFCKGHHRLFRKGITHH